jgi:hypothetical protein
MGRPEKINGRRQSGISSPHKGIPREMSRLLIDVGRQGRELAGTQ